MMNKIVNSQKPIFVNKLLKLVETGSTLERVN